MFEWKKVELFWNIWGVTHLIVYFVQYKLCVVQFTCLCKRGFGRRGFGLIKYVGISQCWKTSTLFEAKHSDLDHLQFWVQREHTLLNSLLKHVACILFYTFLQAIGNFHGQVIGKVNLNKNKPYSYKQSSQWALYICLQQIINFLKL